ncbi:MAG: anhydro-N-acetylmuramic acid kinase [Pseudomonadota bacterium]|nr:anhydro-N-acetylmuramic acid kinase [Pseudomonadota bacterium]
MAKYIGLMSGTSMDGVDAVLCDISSQSCNTLAAHTLSYSNELLTVLNRLCSEGPNELNTLAVADRLVAETFALAVNELLAKCELCASDIEAIGSHGQTIRHYPNGDAPNTVFSSQSARGFTCQIGDPNTIAVLTNIDVIADFRRKDIALGGQGAPLVPAYHNAVFAHKEKHRALVNIGGMANISILAPKNSGIAPLGFDTGPGNTLLDKWAQQHLNKAFDENGNWAASGNVNEALLNHLVKDPYFQQLPPKSTGREYFNLQWLRTTLLSFADTAPEDVQATLLQLTAITIANDVKRELPAPRNQEPNEVIVCGGGAFNNTLMQTLRSLMPAFNVVDSSNAGIHPQHVEGTAFAWLANAFIHNIPGNVPAVTGASRPAVLGALFKSN